MAAWLVATFGAPAWFLLGVNLFLLVVGMFIETSASIIVLGPILQPAAARFGIDPVHFGTIMVVNLALGMVTPPFGVNLFAAAQVAETGIDRMMRYLPVFILAVIVCLGVVTYVPALPLALRDLVYR
jgi:TRAP-type C4-dicarboxylate transport system permease large subunit